MNKTILVTWWLWYIGSHAVIELEQLWFKTVIIDNLSNSSIDSLNWIEKILWYKPDFFKIDIWNGLDLKKLFEKYSFYWVIHFAWLKSVGESCNNPIEYYNNNIIWSIQLFEIMKNFKVLNIIFSSSATVYNSSEIDNKALSENNLTWDCTNPYWTTKFIQEQILRDLSIHSKFNVINLRYFNPIWAHNSWIIWENPKWIPNNLLPYVMKVASWELESLKIFWNDYDTIDWTWVRDYIDIWDLINWHIYALNKLIGNTNKWLFETFNLWTWIWVSVLEIISSVEKITWKKITYSFVWRRFWDLANVYCNPQKAELELKWIAKITLDESIANMWKFYKIKNIKDV